MTQRLPRPLHPGAWWLWALGLATAASRTTNPLLLGLILAVVAYVVVCRRDGCAVGAWRSRRTCTWRLFVIVAIRVVFRMVLGGEYGSSTCCFTAAGDRVAGAAGRHPHRRAR